MEGDPDGEETGSPSKSRRYSAQKKGKAKIESRIDLTEEETMQRKNPRNTWSWSPTVIEIETRLEEIMGRKKPIFTLSLSPIEVETDLALMKPKSVLKHSVTEINKSNSDDPDSNLEKEATQIDDVGEFIRKQRILRRFREERIRRGYEVAREHAHRLANPQDDKDFISNKPEKKVMLKEDDVELGGPFFEAMEMIKKRNSSGFKWVPVKDKVFNALKCQVPSLLDLSLNVLAKNAEAIVSLEHVPDSLRHRISQIICDDRKMNAHFLKLLVSGFPTQICLNDGSQLEIEDFKKFFGACNAKYLTVLQLDRCGRSLTDDVLCDTLARSTHSLPSLATISLAGAYRLTDNGLSILATSAPALQSVNVGGCSLLTSAGITALVSCLESTLRELYTDHCERVDAMVMLPALKELKYLEVLSVAGIDTVSDDFVIEIVKAHGTKLKELVLANCVQLTDRALKFVGQKCSRLSALDISYLDNLTDSTMKYLANGCRSAHSLKLCHNTFSDEAIAAFLEVSGDSLTELSLNNVRGVGLNTALSLAKCSRNLLILDLSWCRRLTDDALGFIVHNCLSLRLLKLFGCTQITDVFLNGHSNLEVQIIGLKLTPVLKHLSVLERQQAPLRYAINFL
ncbi:F-box/LRR-repeat protein 4-like [Melia azedarach]|uniref:F-box/LRR-repeat protein 4-like n=1 Tax=Melia azedarach TaxID=155640 RepID=A0ACC1XDP4_MELAZ|nr:F-box/LRR-repeat protein 4-like [Melia azedarach]